MVTTSIVMLLAGIGFMGAIQDALTGFPLTAGARILEAILATAGIIAGVSGGLTVGQMLGVDLGRLDPGVSTLSEATMVVAGAAVCAGAFAFSSYAPLRSLLPIALIAGVAALVLGLVEELGFSEAWSAAVAALFVGLVSYAAAGRVRVPPLVVVVSAIVPMLPGLSIYRGLSLLAAGGNGILSLMGAARDRHRAGVRRDLRRVRRPAAAPGGATPGAATLRTAAGRTGAGPADQEEEAASRLSHRRPTSPSERAAPGQHVRAHLVARGRGEPDQVGGIAVAHPVVGELVLVVDPDPATATAQHVEVEVDHPRDASARVGLPGGHGRDVDVQLDLRVDAGPRVLAVEGGDEAAVRRHQADEVAR